MVVVKSIRSWIKAYLAGICPIVSHLSVTPENINILWLWYVSAISGIRFQVSYDLILIYYSLRLRYIHRFIKYDPVDVVFLSLLL